MDLKELIETIEGNYHSYHRLLEQLGDDDAASRKVQDTLIREVLHRLTDIQNEVVDLRLKKILVEEHPYLPEIQLEAIQKTEYSGSSSLPQLVRDFLAQRWNLVKLLHSLPQENWERTGVHAREGHVSFRELVRRMADKDRSTLSELNRLVVEHQS